MPDSFIYPSTYPKAVLEDILFNCAAKTRCPAHGKVPGDSDYYRGSAKLTLAAESLCVLVSLSSAEALAAHPSPVILE